MVSVKQIFERNLGISLDDYSEDTNLREDLGLDSLDIIDIIMSIERDLNISIPDSDITNLDTLGDLYKIVEEHTK